jgi:D-alanine-D-alanine ligase
MLSTSFLLPVVPVEKLKVWVLAPYLQTNDANIDYYYDFSQSIAEYSKTFDQLGMVWKWQPVTMNDYASVIDTIVAEKEAGIYFPVVFNICDGDEVNGTPGVSVVKLLEEKGLVYTGSDEYFYKITTSKIPMKKAFDKFDVPNAKWEAIKIKNQYTNGIFERLGSPIIVKPSVSGGSMGVGIKNVVETKAELNEQIGKMFEGYRGWNLAADGLIAESFITGPEFTVLIVGSYNKPGQAKIYTPVERIFHPSLPDKEKFLSFDRLWEIYEEEAAMPNEGNFYEYELPDASLIEAIKKISWDAYVACKGKGYTRVDVRMDSTTKKLYVLEVNAQCGLSEDENYTSIGAILRMSNKTFAELVIEIINDAFLRRVKTKLGSATRKVA